MNRRQFVSSAIGANAISDDRQRRRHAVSLPPNPTLSLIRLLRVAVLSGRRQKVSTFGVKPQLEATLRPISYKRHRFPAEVIRHAVWLHFRFTLSLRDVEELLWDRGQLRDDPLPDTEVRPALRPQATALAVQAHGALASR